MELGALGPLRVVVAGRQVPVDAGRQRAVLAILILRANRLVSIANLIDGIWGDHPPASARDLVHTYIWRVRRLLGDDGGRELLTSSREGYRLQVRESELDIMQFERLMGSGRAAIADGDPARGADLLRAALDLWRGEPLEDVMLHGHYGLELARIAGQRAAAREERIAADLLCGRHETVIAEIEHLLAADPLRESLVAQLMLALHQAGRRADALQTFRQAQLRLADELGLDPAAELRRLHQQILADDPALKPRTPPRRDITPDVPRQLPAAVQHFTGRDAELSVLTGLLRQVGTTGCSVVISAIEGTAGIGKTALAVHFAHQAAPSFPDGQLYIDLRGFGSAGPPVIPADVIRIFLQALAVPGDRLASSLDELTGIYRTVLASKQMLVVLDNARDAGQVRPLIPGNPRCLVIVTSRSQLTGLAATEAAQIVTLDLLTSQESRDLLTRRLGARRVAREPGATDELIALCARLPLALSVAAARAATRPELTLANLAGELRDVRTRLDALDTGDLAADTRAVFSWSYQNLSGQAAHMFRLLGVHPGPDIGISAAASLAGISRPDVVRALGELTRASLVTEPVAGRYGFHDLLRAYAAERAHADGSLADCRAAIRRMLDHYLHSAHAAVSQRFTITYPVLGAPPADVIPDNPRGQEASLGWLTAEQRVLLAVIPLAYSETFDTHAWQIALVTSQFLNLRLALQDWVAVQRVAVAAARRSGDRAGLAHTHDSLGYALARIGRFEAAAPLLLRAMAIFRQLGDKAGQASVHNSLAMMHEWQGDLDQAIAHAQETLRLSDAVGNRPAQAHALNNIGWLHSQLGDHRRALAYCLEALQLHHDLGNQFGQAATLDSLGHAHHRLGEYQRAIACYEQALNLIGRLDDRYHEATILRHLGDTRHAIRDHDAARTAWHKALAILDELHHPDAERLLIQLHDLDQAQPGLSGQQAQRAVLQPIPDPGHLC